jgi:hypothetical protein
MDESLVLTGNKCLMSYVVQGSWSLVRRLSRSGPTTASWTGGSRRARPANIRQSIPPLPYLVSTICFGGFTILYSVSDLSNHSNFCYGFSSKANTRCMEPYARVDYNITFCSLQSRLQHIYHGQPFARVDLNPMLESNLSPSQRFWI